MHILDVDLLRRAVDGRGVLDVCGMSYYVYVFPFPAATASRPVLSVAPDFQRSCARRRRRRSRASSWYAGRA